MDARADAPPILSEWVLIARCCKLWRSIMTMCCRVRPTPFWYWKKGPHLLCCVCTYFIIADTGHNAFWVGPILTTMPIRKGSVLLLFILIFVTLFVRFILTSCWVRCVSVSKWILFSGHVYSDTRSNPKNAVSIAACNMSASANFHVGLPAIPAYSRGWYNVGCVTMIITWIITVLIYILLLSQSQ